MWLVFGFTYEINGFRRITFSKCGLVRLEFFDAFVTHERERVEPVLAKSFWQMSSLLAFPADVVIIAVGKPEVRIETASGRHTVA